MNRGVTYSALLRGTSYRHCFISFPHHWRAFISPATVPTFVIESVNESIVVSWAGHTHDQDSEDEVFVCINSKLLHANGFSEGEVVVVRQVSCPSPCTSAFMTVLCDSDWEELALNIEVAQNAFLTQFRVVKKDQIFPLWLEGGLFIYLKVNACVPSTKVSLLQQNTEVKVLPLPQASSSIPPVTLKPLTREKLSVDSSNNNKPNEKNILRFIYTLFILLGYGFKRLETLPKQEVFLSLKVVNFSSRPSDKHHLLSKLLTRHPSIVIASKKNFRRTKWESASYLIGKIYKHNNTTEKNSNNVDSSQESSIKLLAVVMIWEKLRLLLKMDRLSIDDIDIMLSHKTCILGVSLRKKLLLNETDIIILETSDLSLKSKSFHIDVDTVNSRRNTVDSAITASFSELIHFCPIIINNKTMLTVNVEGICENLLLSTRGDNFVVVEKGDIRQLSFHVETISEKQFPNAINLVEEKKSFDHQLSENVTINENIFSELLGIIKRDLHLEMNEFRLCPQFILLQGNKGSGKTTMIKNLVTRLRGSPYFVHCHVISLKILKGKKVDSVQKLLKPAISEALNLKPSLLVLDDLDFLTNLNSIMEEKGVAYEYANHMAFMVKNLLSQLLDYLKNASRNVTATFAESVMVLATCLSRNDVHFLLASPKGSHIFPKSLSIRALSEESKFSFLCHSLENMFNIFIKDQKFSWIENATGDIFIFKKEEITPKLDGLTLPDIKNLSLRIFLEAKTRWLNDSRILEDILCIDNYVHCPFVYTDTDVTVAYSGFISSSMRALNTHPTKRKENKIGGLHKARQTLEEMILWPSKYPQLFSQTTLKLRSGILLYGPPGCGKTLLAKSFESYPHLSFITVKGPELLSKYIGQSEKAVRDAFERAASVKPCVLFFDEFESIAPRRGHDNTGVTDRVVNQLLTQMDGVEGLSGVYVIGATSRPELIDPALLRPGRLDKGIYCPIPDEKEREEILNILCEDVNLDDLIDIRDIAQRTKGYSGADLQCVLSTALVKAAQEHLGKSLYEPILEDGDESSENDSFSNELLEVTDLLEIRNINDETANFDKSVNSDQLILCVTLEHISAALAEVRPSVEKKERLIYEALHLKFSSNKESKYFTEVKPGKKETLA